MYNLIILRFDIRVPILQAPPHLPFDYHANKSRSLMELRNCVKKSNGLRRENVVSCIMYRTECTRLIISTKLST